MKRFSWVTAVLSIGLVAGCRASSDASIAKNQNEQHTAVTSSVADQADTKTRRHRFTVRAMGRSGRTGAEFVSFQTFASDDGVTVRRFIENYASPAQANRRFDNLVSPPNKVVEPVSKVDLDGETGNRAIVTLPQRDGDYSGTLIVLIQGNQVDVLEGSSLPDLLDFERQVLAQQ